MAVSGVSMVVMRLVVTERQVRDLGSGMQRLAQSAFSLLSAPPTHLIAEEAAGAMPGLLWKGKGLLRCVLGCVWHAEVSKLHLLCVCCLNALMGQNHLVLRHGRA